MELVLGAMGSLVPKLGKLLEDELVKQMGLRSEVEILCRELPMMQAALVEVSKVPPEQLKETDKVWAQRVRELSYDMEDAVDNFMVCVARREPSQATAASNVFKKAFKDIARKTKAPLKKLMDRHRISDEIREIKDLSNELSKLRKKYEFNGVANTRDAGVDPRVINLRKSECWKPVGIEESRDDLLRMLTSTHPGLKVVSIYGSGGLGKTTLAKLVHDQLKAQKPSFEYSAFVSVGRNPNLTNTLREMLEKLGKRFDSYMTSWNTQRFCEGLHEFLQNKRYNIVVDDVWEKETWDSVKSALPDSNCGSKVIMTTRKFEVGKEANDVYKLKPLSDEKSKELFCTRTSTKNNGHNELVDKIIGKCDGVPLAIIAIASLLADKPLVDWQTVYDSLIVGHEDKTREILLYSYYDLPPHLKSCMLYLSMYPEDCKIEKSALIWRWIAEGFVQLENEGCILLEVGERYFDELLNRSMIQAVFNKRFTSKIDGCLVHDVVLDLIRDLSIEENFVTILGKKQLIESSANVTRSMKELGLMHGLERKVRRLSIQTDISLDTIGMPEVVRSLEAANHLIDVSQLSRFRTCRVLSIRQSIGSLKHLDKLLHLRYLDIREANVDELPKELGNLKSMQTMIAWDGRYPQNTPAVFELTQLMCLHAFVMRENVINIGNLVCLEELKIGLAKDIVLHDLGVALGKLTRLRVLEIFSIYEYNACSREWMQYLSKLQEIRELKVFIQYSSYKWVETTWAPTRETHMGLSPRLMDPSCFRRLSCLALVVPVAEAGDTLWNLALLPELRSLKMEIVGGEPLGFIVFADGFQNLRHLQISTWPTKPKFMPGAMPRLESLNLMVRPGRDLEEINLATLLSLKEVIIEVWCYDYFLGDVEEAEVVVRREVEDNSNRPTLHIRRSWEYRILSDDETKPDKVIRVPVIARQFSDIYENDYDDAGMMYCRWLEEITCDLDCEGSSLSHVEYVEARLRVQAARHPRRPKLVINRINQHKMKMDGSPEVYSMYDAQSE